MTKPNAQKILSTFTLSFLASLLAIIILIFALPRQIPLLCDIHENIAVVGSKWWFFIFVFPPIIFASLEFFSKTRLLTVILKTLKLISIYEIMMLLIYFLAGQNFDIGAKIEMPISLLIFFPLSVIYTIFGFNIKHLPYKNRFGIKNKYTLETEFIWKQTHFLASRVFALTGLLLMLISLIFSLFHYSIYLLLVFAIAILTDYSVVLFQSKAMYKKYIEMKNRKDNLKFFKDKNLNNKSQESTNLDDKKNDNDNQDKKI